MDKAKREACEKTFATHKAELIQNTERFLIIDWRKEDGSSHYYVNYIVDKKRGSLIVSGDLGDSIATWFNPLEPAKLKRYIQDIGYYVGKFQATSHGYFYGSENIIADMKNEIEVDDDSFTVDGDIYSIDELWKLIEEEVESCIYDDNFIPSDNLNHILEEIGCVDALYWLYGCGKRIENNVYLWAVGFDMACEQLGI